MELSILEHSGKKVNDIADNQTHKKGIVLEVRKWPASPMIEIDLHLPGAGMEGWNTIPHIKISVDDLIFCDYIPFGWDAETSTCSILIDSSQKSKCNIQGWRLSKGDLISYLNIYSDKQVPCFSNPVVVLGDNSSLAHLLALKQLAYPQQYSCTILLTDSPQTAVLMGIYFEISLTAYQNEAKLAEWLAVQGYNTKGTTFYLTGNCGMVNRFNRLLANSGFQQIYLNGF